MNTRPLIVVVVALALSQGSVWAGTVERLGTGGGSELRISVGARSVAMAGSDVGSMSGAEALFGNPAGLADTDNQTEVLLSYTKYIADMNVNYLAVAQKLGDFGSLGVSAKVLSIGDIVRTTETSPDGTGDVFTPTFTTLGATYAKQLTDRASFGGTIYYISESVMQTSSGGMAFDFGFQFDTDYHGVRLGAAMKNFGGSQTFAGADFESNLRLPGDDPQSANRTISLASAEYELPSLFAGGVSWPVLLGVNSLTLHGLYQSNSFGVDELRFGGEYRWRKDAALRLGYKATSDNNELFNFSYGLGVRVPLAGQGMNIDYAGQVVSDFFDDVHHISVSFQF